MLLTMFATISVTLTHAARETYETRKGKETKDTICIIINNSTNNSNTNYNIHIYIIIRVIIVVVIIVMIILITTATCKG